MSIEFLPPVLGPDGKLRETPIALVWRGKRGADFLREYKPISYSIDGILPSSSIYALTGKKSSAKTAFLQGVALSVISGKPEICGFDIERGRVAYIIFENPDNFRMRLAILAHYHAIPDDLLNEILFVIDTRMTTPELLAEIRSDAEAHGPFQLVIYDTFQAGFPGGDFNNNAEELGHTRDIRTLIEVPGKPSILVAAHPTKDAGKDKLKPYGGGSIINELDGNLSIWNESGLIEFYFTRVRGPEFEPIFFTLQTTTSSLIIDNKGRMPLAPFVQRQSETEREQKEDTVGDGNTQLMLIMESMPLASMSKWAGELLISRQAVRRRIGLLEKKKLVVEGANNRWRLTTKGIREVKEFRGSNPEPPKPNGEYHASPEPTATFEPAPGGTNIATCFRVIDLGTQRNDYKGEVKTQHQIMLSWELANKTTKTGKPVTISKTLNFSMHEMATMRSFVEALMGRTLRKEDLYGKDRFDIRHLLGRPCLLTIQHVESGDKISAKIIACVPVPEGMTAPETISANAFFSLQPGLFDQDTDYRTGRRRKSRSRRNTRT